MTARAEAAWRRVLLQQVQDGDAPRALDSMFPVMWTLTRRDSPTPRYWVAGMRTGRGDILQAEGGSVKQVLSRILQQWDNANGGA